MIPKLKRKFVLINMSLVSVVLIIVFVCIGLFSYEEVKQESFFAMEKAIGRQMDMDPPKMEIGKKIDNRREPFIPTFSVLVDENQGILSISKENVNVTDEFVEEVTQAVLDADEEIGVFWDSQLRYLVRVTPEGKKIAFADMNREIERMTNLLTTMSLVGLGALGAFFLVSLYLAKWALKPVDEAWEKQKRFVADASHELKTPLTVILANTGILLSHKEETIKDQAKWVEYTQAEANRMKKLVDDLLFLAKYDSEHKPQLQSEINLSDVLWGTVLPFESLAFESGVEIDTEIASDLSIPGNEGQLRQLGVILMDNACKYAGEGGRVKVSLSKQTEGILLKINNTGTPISQEHLAHIFDRFYRAESARTRETGGYGLGLSIANTIVETHNGKITATSNEKEGTTFQVLF